MVAKTIPLPNARRIFVPDPGYAMAEIDLAGADARVVAWEADDADLKQKFNEGLKVHVENAREMWGAAKMGSDGKKEPLYTETKRAVHLSNYGGSPRAICLANAWTMKESEDFQRRWFEAHPAIRSWQNRVEGELMETRTVRNRFGYQFRFFDRIETVLKDALAWVPQSTVALVINKGMTAVDEQVDWVRVLMQVHDSFVFQFQKHRRNDLGLLLPLTSIEIPYDDPLVIPPELKTSDASWGDCEATEWPKVA